MLLEQDRRTGQCIYWGEVYMMDEIVGEAANLMEALPWYATVFITSGDVLQVAYMQEEMKEYGITDLKFVTPQQILNGALRGRIGVLLIKNEHLMSPELLHCVKQERDMLSPVLTERMS